MKFIIAEKNSVALEIATVLGCKRIEGSAYANAHYLIIGAIGHLCGYVPVENEPWATLAELPKLCLEFETKANEKTKPKLDEIKALFKAHKKQITCVINACDAGREGELIFKLILENLSVSAFYPIKRMWLKSMTHDGILEAVENLRDNMKNLEAAARTRAKADFWLGINFTRAFTNIQRQKSNTADLYNTGRVQSPTLAYVVKRDMQIANFKSKDLHIPFINYSNLSQKDSNRDFTARLQIDDTLLENKSAVLALLESVSKSKIVSVEDIGTVEKRNPPTLFDLTSLQRHMNKNFNYSAKETLDIAQSLYEKHKLLTYPRTDSKCLPEDYPNLLSQLVDKILEKDKIPSFNFSADVITRIQNSKYQTLNKNKRLFNNEGITDHHAIIVTLESESISKLNTEELAVYSEVALNILSQFMGAEIAEITIRTITHEQGVSTLKGRIISDLGFTLLYKTENKTNDDVAMLHPIDKDNLDIQVASVGTKLSKTTAPPAITESALLGFMENPTKSLAGSEKDIMKDKGLGTPATRASIIEELLSDKNRKGDYKEPYLIRKGKTIISTPKAYSLVQLINSLDLSVLLLPNLTAQWEMDLFEIEQGKKDPAVFVENLNKFITTSIKKLQGMSATLPKNESPEFQINCPACAQKPILSAPYSFKCKSCAFELKKTIAGNKLPMDAIASLLDKKKTKTLQFTSFKTSKQFEAGLFLNPDKNYAADFIFADRK